MRHLLDTCRWVYNKTLEARRDAWQERQESLSLYDTYKLLTGWRGESEWLARGHAQTMQNAQHRVDLAFKAFFRRAKQGQEPGYPRFKGRDRYDSFTYPQSTNWRFSDDARLQLAKIGNVKIKLHRPIEGKAKTLTIKRDALGNWWASFTCEVEPVPLPKATGIVGIDLGIVRYATLSTGEEIKNPRLFRRDQEELVKAQQKLSACATGTPEYRKCKRVVQHIHQRVVNRRRDFAHKLSRRLVDQFQVIALEDLHIQEMQSGIMRNLNRAIGDAAWRQLITMTQYKAEWAGRTVVMVDERNTSEQCSRCGQIVKKTLRCRIHSCPHCGLEMNRDLNAALNILGRGLASLGQVPESPSLARREQSLGPQLAFSRSPSY